MKQIILALSAILAIGCESPWKGSGALYYAERGEIKCVNADYVTFLSSRSTVFEVSGVKTETDAALDYYPSLTCEFLEGGK